MVGVALRPVVAWALAEGRKVHTTDNSETLQEGNTVEQLKDERKRSFHPFRLVLQLQQVKVFVFFCLPICDD